jgi:uncharacterized protein YceK
MIAWHLLIRLLGVPVGCEQVNRRTGEQVSVTLRPVDQKKAGMERNIDSCNSHSVFQLPPSICRDTWLLNIAIVAVRHEVTR